MLDLWDNGGNKEKHKAFRWSAGETLTIFSYPKNVPMELKIMMHYRQTGTSWAGTGLVFPGTDLVLNCKIATRPFTVGQEL